MADTYDFAGSGSWDASLFGAFETNNAADGGEISLTDQVAPIERGLITTGDNRPDTWTWSRISSLASHTDIDAYFDWRFEDLSSFGSYFRFTVRHDLGWTLGSIPIPDNGYSLNIARQAGGGWVEVRSHVGGSTEDLGDNEFLTYEGGDEWRVRFLVDGYDLKVKIWDRAVEEPDTWLIETTDVLESHASGSYSFDNLGRASDAGEGSRYYIDNLDAGEPLGPITGGLRDRFVLESVLQDIKAHLDSLGWFDPGRDHSPITIVDEFPDEDGDVPINTMAFSLGDTFTDPLELGSPAEELRVPIYVDFFAESDGLGRHVVGDIHNHVSKQGQFDVKDYRRPVPTDEFIVQVIDGSVERRKPARAVNAWQKNWHVVSFRVTDERSYA